jgi:exopolyphosphatase/pppGpp-phosphohydrolase
VDLGNAVDFYNRLNRTASIIVRTDLPGFTHRESAQAAAILLEAETGQLPRRFRNSRLLSRDDAMLVRQAAAVLLVADELDRRLPPDCSGDVVQIGGQSGTLTVTTPWWSVLAGPGIRDRWRKAFGEEIHIGRGER